MPSTSSLLAEDKALIKKAIPSGNKILTATVVRIFYQSGNDWVYSGVQGGACLVVDKQRGGVWWKVVDLLGTRGVIWEHELPSSSTWSYNQDRGFFHTFPSEDTNVAFVFADEGEAGEMYKKVHARGKYYKDKKKTKAPSGASSTGSVKKKKGGKIDKSLISGPSEGSFKHVAHMGYSSESGFSSSGVDPSWQALLDQLGSQGISQKQIMENEGFIRDFVQKSGGPPPLKPEPKKRAPPPAPTSKRKAPPPPPRTMTTVAASHTPSTPPMPSRPTSTLPPPPPPAPVSAPYQQQPPPPPSRAAPPPMAPSLPSRGPVPPPPPPPPSTGSAPPVPTTSLGLPEVTAPRANLLASIQGVGIQKLKSKSGGSAREDAGGGAPPLPPARAPPPPAPTSASPAIAAAVGAGAGAGVGAGAIAVAASEDNSAGGGDLASALAAALSTRKGNMGDSDEEDESDDEWD